MIGHMPVTIFRSYEKHPFTGSRNAEIGLQKFVKSQNTN